MHRLVELVSALESSPPGGGYVLAGEEEFLRSEAEQAVIRAVLGEAGRGAGLVVIDAIKEGGGQVPLAEVLDEVRTSSLFVPRKVVSVRRAGALVRAAADALAEFLAQGETPGVLLLHAETWDKRAAYARKLDEYAVDCSSLYETAFGETEISANSPLGRWVRERARSSGLRLSGEAVVRLIGLVGTNLAELAGAVERLALSRAGKRDVQPAEVDEVVAPSRSYSQFRVAELALEGRAADCFAAADACFEQGLEKKSGRVEHSEAAIAESLVWAISQELERLYIARGLLDEGRLDAKTAGALGVPPFRLEAFSRRVRAAEAGKLARALAATLDAARSLRGESEPRAAIETLVLRLGEIMGGIRRAPGAVSVGPGTRAARALSI